MLSDQMLTSKTDLTNDQNMSQILLSISNDIAATRTKDDFINIIRARFKSLVEFDDIIILLYEKEIDAFYIWAHHFSAERLHHPDFDLRIESEYPTNDGVLNIVFGQQEPVVFDIEELYNSGPVPDHIAYHYHTGLKELTGVVMRSSTTVVGGFFLTSTKKGNFKKEHLAFIKGISSQICIAVSNILANEAVLKHQEEKSVLLGLTNAIAAVRSKKDLMRVVRGHLDKDPTVADVIISYFEPKIGIHHIYNDNIVFGVNDDAKALNTIPADHLFSKSFNDKIIKGNKPVTFDITDQIKTGKVSSYIERLSHNGVKEITGIAMRAAGSLLGCVYIATKNDPRFKKDDFQFIQGIADQLTIALVNIITSDEISEREKEKSILLSISNSMAAIRNISDLMGMIQERLKNLLSVSHVITLEISDDENWYTASFPDPDSSLETATNYNTIKNRRYAVKDGFVDISIQSDKPIILDLDDVANGQSIPKYLKMNHQAGIKEVVLAPLRDGVKNNGVLVILMNEKNKLDQNSLSFIQGVSDQLSIAIANIKANEKIEQQLNEINQFKKQLEEENLYLQEEIQTTHNYSELIGNSSVMKNIFKLVSKVAESESSVLILGETGTGKELIARAIHNTSLRKDKVMIKVNCATLPANLIESELFGHERGSFTGATEKRIGKFELANNSTLFLDEVGELPLDLQVKLLRVLQEKEIERVGGRTIIKTNVRIIAATNRDLQKEVQMGSFRSDLYFRLNVFPIIIPSLRERKEDIPLLASHFLSKLAKKSLKSNMSFSGKAIRELSSYEWPGNVRELEHLIERSILLSNNRVIEHVYLPNLALEDYSLSPGLHTKTIDEVERDHIISVLKKCNGKVSGAGGAAELLKIPATTLSSKMTRLKIGKGLVSEINHL